MWIKYKRLVFMTSELTHVLIIRTVVAVLFFVDTIHSAV